MAISYEMNANKIQVTRCIACGAVVASRDLEIRSDLGGAVVYHESCDVYSPAEMHITDDENTTLRSAVRAYKELKD